jgi:hypothetical protein
MPQAFFYYQQKVDPSRFAAFLLPWLAPQVPAPGRVRVVPASVITPDAYFLAPPLDVSWAQGGGVFLPRLRTATSGEASAATVLVPPLDLSWLPGVPPGVRRVASPPSSTSDPTSFLAPPIDLSWLRGGSVLGGQGRTVARASHQVSPVEIISGSVPLLLDWLGPPALLERGRQTSQASVGANPAVFPEPGAVPDPGEPDIYPRWRRIGRR